ncbi:MAG TPA: phosphate propanoyltransferase [Isosphaeraceae bacterium]
MSLATLTDRASIERLVRSILEQKVGSNGKPSDGGFRPNLVVNISARHVHLKQEDVDILFGPGYQLTPMKTLFQATDFASNETVSVVGPRQRMIPGIRILGPCRTFTQVELSFTDAISLGIDIPVRLSGDIEGTPGCLMIGPKGSIVLPNGVIRAERHVHMGPKDCEYYGVKHLDRMNLRVEGPCPGTLEGLLVRMNKDWKLEVHIDTDEANCLDLPHATKVELVKA